MTTPITVVVAVQAAAPAQTSPPTTLTTTTIALIEPPPTAAPPTTLPLYDLTVQPTCEIGATVDLGDTGDAVRCLQVRLDEITPGAGVVVDGVFSAATDSQVRLFQAVHALTADGVVGPQTAGMLSIWNPAPPPPPPTTPPPPPPTTTPPPPATTAPPPQIQPAVGQTGAYYENCDAARAAGVDPIYEGEPGYRSKLDRDDDGIACE